MSDRSSRRGPSRATQRAQRLLVGGLVGGHLVAAVAIVSFGLARGATGALSAAVGAVATLVFYTIGLGVQVAVADASPKRVLGASLASYVVRVSVFGVLLGVALTHADAVAWIDDVALVVATIAVVIGWLAAEAWVHARLRIPTYDESPTDAVDSSRRM